MTRFNDALLAVEPHALKEKLNYLYSNSKHEGLRQLIPEGRIKNERMLDNAVEGFMTGEDYRKHYPTRTETRNEKNEYKSQPNQRNDKKNNVNYEGLESRRRNSPRRYAT